MFRTLRRSQLVVDVVVAGAFGLVMLVLTETSLLGFSVAGGLYDTLLAFVLTGLFAVALALRRLSPALALIIAWVGAVAQMLCQLPPLPVNVAILGVLYTCAAYGSVRLYWIGFASALVGALTISVYLVVPSLAYSLLSTGSGLASLVFTGGTVFLASALGLLLAWTIGALVRTRLRARRSVAAQQEAEARATVEFERNRIARDMHDVVAHSLAVVIAQADGARYAAADDPAAASASLQTIATTARAALTDVRLLLAQLRHDEAPGPQPTVADLEALYAQVRAAGVDLRVDIDPAPAGEPPAAVQLAVYRILQEALTNALRHGAPGGPVEVSLAWRPDRVEVRVRNPLGSVRPSGGAGAHGLVGMRERAQLIGGTFGAGPAGGEFLVAAALPIGAGPIAAPGSIGAVA